MVAAVIMVATVKIAVAAGGRHASIEATADGENTVPRSLRAQVGQFGGDLAQRPLTGLRPASQQLGLLHQLGVDLSP
jgi:hypothetical protein